MSPSFHQLQPFISPQNPTIQQCILKGTITFVFLILLFNNKVFMGQRQRRREGENVRRESICIVLRGDWLRDMEQWQGNMVTSHFHRYQLVFIISYIGLLYQPLSTEATFHQYFGHSKGLRTANFNYKLCFQTAFVFRWGPFPSKLSA